MTLIATYPGGPSSLVTTFPGANPAAGANYTFTKTAGSLYLIHGFSFTFVAGGAAANRQLTVSIDDGTAGNFVFEMRSNTVLTATQTAIVTMAVHGTGELVFTNSAGNFDFQEPWPFGSILYPGFRLRISSLNIQAADQITRGGFFAEEFLLP